MTQIQLIDSLGLLVEGGREAFVLFDSFSLPPLVTVALFLTRHFQGHQLDLYGFMESGGGGTAAALEGQLSSSWITD